MDTTYTRKIKVRCFLTLFDIYYIYVCMCVCVYIYIYNDPYTLIIIFTKSGDFFFSLFTEMTDKVFFKKF